MRLLALPLSSLAKRTRKRRKSSVWPSGSAPSLACCRPWSGRLVRMPPLITFDEAIELAEMLDHDQIARPGRARLGGPHGSASATRPTCARWSTRSPGGCAEDCGFCAQSRYAEADTPMHAMMEPEQILEHAKAAEAAGAHRFCMVTQGQGLSKRDFEKIVDGAKLVAENTNLKRCVSIGHISADRAQQARRRGGPARPPQRRDRALLLRGGDDHGSLRGAHRARSTPSRRRGSRRASAASSISANRRASAWRWRSSWPRSIPPRCRSTC